MQWHSIIHFHVDVLYLSDQDVFVCDRTRKLASSLFPLLSHCQCLINIDSICQEKLTSNKHRCMCEFVCVCVFIHCVAGRGLDHHHSDCTVHTLLFSGLSSADSGLTLSGLLCSFSSLFLSVSRSSAYMNFYHSNKSAFSCTNILSLLERSGRNTAQRRRYRFMHIIICFLFYSLWEMWTTLTTLTLNHCCFNLNE